MMPASNIDDGWCPGCANPWEDKPKEGCAFPHHQETYQKTLEERGAIDTTEVKAKLRSLKDHLPSADSRLAKFAEVLAEYIGDVGITPSGFLLSSELLLADLRSGKSGHAHITLPPELVGQPPIAIVSLHARLESVIRSVCPIDFYRQVMGFKKSVEAEVAKEGR
jgi:hypothetical protein